MSFNLKIHMGLHLKPIDIVDDITQEEFIEKYLKPRKPVVIKNMEKKGWLTREACQTDKRAFEVDLTDEGRRIIQAAIPPHQRAIEETFSVLTLEEQAQLVELLKKFKNV